jgi:hypothetical protein
MKATNFSVHSLLSASAVALMLGLAATPAGATVVYNSWTSNETPNGNYILTVTDAGSVFNYSLTVSPWNAEALGLFIDLGDVVMPAVTLTNVSPLGQVSVFDTDQVAADGNDSDCGSGCNLGGIPTFAPALGGGDWELVLTLGSTGFDGIQTFSWTTSDFGLSEAAFGRVGIRAQQLCLTTGTTLPTGQCGGSDKVVGFGTIQDGGGPQEAPEPGVLLLMGAGLLGLGMARRRKSA